MTRLMMLGRLALLTALSIVAASCLVKEDTATWYLDRSGALTWSVVEKDVHSDAENVTDQQSEESGYLASVRALNHPVARGFAELRPLEVRTRILRAGVPFTVVTEATFPNLAALGEMVILRLGLSGSSTLIHGAEGTTWTFSVRDPQTLDASMKPDDDLMAAGAGLERLKVVLLEGRFASAVGFELSRDRRTATLVERDGDVLKDGADYVLKLTW